MPKTSSHRQRALCGSLTQTLSNQDHIVCESQTVPNQEQTTISCSSSQEFRHQPNNRDLILRDLGVLYLDNKFTRPRRSDDETEAMILKEAGISYVEDEYKAASKLFLEKKGGRFSKAMIRTLSSQDAEILRKAGVTWDDKTNEIIRVDTTVTNITSSLQRSLFGAENHYHETYHANKENNTQSSAVTVNSTYAERELTRLLKKGWSSTGKECNACGMPIIIKSKGGLLECVICGVLGGEDDYNNSDVEDINTPIVNPAVRESPGLIEMDTTVSSMTTYLQKSASDTRKPNSGIHQAKENETDDVFHEALGSRLFDGWHLSRLNCPHCKLPLISEFECAPTVCLRCG
jgi:uncharacterized Zn finger protein (UPF0148 family)